MLIHSKGIKSFVIILYHISLLYGIENIIQRTDKGHGKNEGKYKFNEPYGVWQAVLNKHRRHFIKSAGRKEWLV